jgi:hypothetical protein
MHVIVGIGIQLFTADIFFRSQIYFSSVIFGYFPNGEIINALTQNIAHVSEQ